MRLNDSNSEDRHMTLELSAILRGMIMISTLMDIACLFGIWITLQRYKHNDPSVEGGFPPLEIGFSTVSSLCFAHISSDVSHLVFESLIRFDFRPTVWKLMTSHSISMVTSYTHLRFSFIILRDVPFFRFYFQLLVNQDLLRYARYQDPS